MSELTESEPSVDDEVSDAAVESILGIADDLAEVATQIIEPDSVEIPDVSGLIEQPSESVVPEPEPAAEPGPDPLDVIMQRIVDVTDADKYLRICIYGPPGQRKTSFCATAPDALMFELDTGGSKSLMNTPELAVGISKLPFRSMYQFNLFQQYLVNDDERLAKYKTYIIDTYNGLQSKDLSEIPAMSDGKPNYNINTQNLKRITDQLKHINKHVIITAHVKEVKDESSGRILIRPDLTDKVAAAVYGDFDIIGYMTVEEGTWTLRLEPTPTITAKTRVGGLPPVIENPNFGMILNAYEVTRARAKGNN